MFNLPKDLANIVNEYLNENNEKMYNQVMAEYKEIQEWFEDHSKPKKSLPLSLNPRRSHKIFLHLKHNDILTKPLVDYRWCKITSTWYWLLRLKLFKSSSLDHYDSLKWRDIIYSSGREE
tara:strand:+ start:772 stop:1131 length:360 start_codon:yes stop_codon:yes gene_type:complete